MISQLQMFNELHHDLKTTLKSHRKKLLCRIHEYIQNTFLKNTPVCDYPVSKMNLLMTATYTYLKSGISQILCRQMKKFTLETVEGLSKL